MSRACVWCGASAADGFVLVDAANARGARFCRLEHLVAWSIRGPRWEAAPAAVDALPERCSLCEAAAPALLLVRTRGPHRIVDGFCTLDHLLAWARAGGRYGSIAPGGNADAPGA